MKQVGPGDGTSDGVSAGAVAPTCDDQAALPLAVSPCDVGPEVRRLRLAAGWTQEELARRSGTSQPAIACLESGRRMPTLPTLEKLAAALGRSLVVMLPSREILGEPDARLRSLAGVEDAPAVDLDGASGTKSLPSRSALTPATA